MRRQVLAAILTGLAAFVISRWVDSLWGQQDDAFITYQYAKRLAAGHGFSYAPGAAPTYGTTTPLWTLLLAAGAKLGAAPHLLAPWLNAILHACAAAFATMVAGPVAGAVWATAFAVFFRTGGMETPLVVALSALVVFLLVRRGSPWAIGVACGLLLWTRPDTALFVAAAAFAVGRRGRGSGFPVAGVALLVYAPWLLYASRVFGRIVPSSLTAKYALLWYYPRASLATFVAEFFPRDLGPLVFAAAASAAAFGARRLWEQPVWRPLLLWIAAYWACLLIFGAPNFSWYYIPPLWLGVCVASAGLRELSRRRIAALASVLALALCGWISLQDLRASPEASGTRRELAERVRSLSRPGDAVAAEEIGTISYWSDRPTVDLLGGTDPTLLPRLTLGQWDAILDEKRPRFVVLARNAGPWSAHYRAIYTHPWRKGQDYIIYERVGE